MTSAPRPVRVQHIPAGHPYVRRLLPAPTSAEPGSVEFLPDPPVPGAPAERWWPHPALEPSWIDANAHRLDVVHLHFGFEHRCPRELNEFIAALRRHGIPLVHTVHDLSNPHVPDDPEHLARLDVAVPGADALLTLTPAVADVVHARWGRRPSVVAHPHVVDAPRLRRPRPPAGEAFVVGVHLKSLRPNVDARCTMRALVAATRRPGVILRVDLHAEALHPSFRRYDAGLHVLLQEAAARGEIDLRVHDPLTDDELYDAVAGLDLAVLPYASGTHSGWLEMCHDLGTPAVVPDLPLAGQRPARVYRRADLPGSLIRQVEAAIAAGPTGRGEPRDEFAAERLGEQAEAAAVHARLYSFLAEGR